MTNNDFWNSQLANVLGNQQMIDSYRQYELAARFGYLGQQQAAAPVPEPGMNPILLLTGEDE